MNDAAVDVVTFGCRLNISESEVMQRNALAAGLRDTVIVNTCAVTAEAERQAGQAIRRLRRERPSAKIVVTGCASHISPKKFEDFKEVDFVLKNDTKLEVTAFAAMGGNSDLVAETAPMPRATGILQRAFVQVQNGCDHRCTFCIIPYGRGVSRSLPVQVITERVRAHVQNGFNEVVLTGVDITSYGHDLPTLPTLGLMIRAVLAQVPSLTRLRLSSLDPAAIDSDLWFLIANEPRLMPHLHLSLQAGDDLILKRMKRRHSRQDVLELCRRAREVRPDVVFGADVIAGFPTETNAMFENTYDLVEKCNMTWLHVFTYSSRQGTPAAKMPQVHGSLRKERSERLRAYGEKAVQSHMGSLIGQNIEVLVENHGVGCTPHFAKLKLEGSAPIGHIVSVIGKASPDGEIVGEVVGTL